MRKFLFILCFFLSLFSSAQTDRSTGHILADYKGGHAEFNKLITLEMYYPREALLEGDKGKVVLEVLIQPTGESMISRVIKGPSESLIKEAKRLVNLAEFIPASMDGNPMLGKKTVAVRFSPRKYNLFTKTRGYDEIPSPNIKINPSNKVFKKKDVNEQAIPRYPSAFKSFEEYTYQRLTYPTGAYSRNIEGKTTIEFVVETSGNLTNMYPVEYLGAGCYEEAKRVLRSVKWNPAIKNGKAVRSRQTQTIIFKLPEAK